MPLYRNVSGKRLMLAGVQTLLSVPNRPDLGSYTAPQNRFIEPGETVQLSDEAAAALGARVELVNV